MRISKLGGTIRIVFDFAVEQNSILLSLQVRRGKNYYDLYLQNSKVPDSFVVDDVWYNLYVNYQDVQVALDYAGISKLGSISLGQYIKIRQFADDNPNIEVIDNAAQALSEHPVKEIDFAPPAKLTATLYPYQKIGYQWMRFVIDSQCGCILGDEMGLGKTVQIIALITEQKQEGKGPALVIAPVSLLENWKRELEKFTNGIKVLVHHGSGRTGLYTDFDGYDVVIISYNTASSDQSLLKMVDWNLITLRLPHRKEKKIIKISTHLLTVLTIVL